MHFVLVFHSRGKSSYYLFLNQYLRVETKKLEQIHILCLSKLDKPETQWCMRMVAKNHICEHSLDCIDCPEVDLQRVLNQVDSFNLARSFSYVHKSNMAMVSVNGTLVNGHTRDISSLMFIFDLHGDVCCCCAFYFVCAFFSLSKWTIPITLFVVDKFVCKRANICVKFLKSKRN